MLNIIEQMKLGIMPSSGVFATIEASCGYSFDLFFSTQQELFSLDLECSERYLLCGSYRGWMILDLSDDGVSLVSNFQSPKVIFQTKWFPIDPSIFFTLDSSLAIIWDSNTGKRLESLSITNGKELEVQQGENGLVAVNCGNSVKFVDIANWKENLKAEGKFSTFKWSPIKDEIFVTSGDNGSLSVWDIRRIKSPVFNFGAEDEEILPNKFRRIQDSRVRITNRTVNLYNDTFMKANLNITAGSDKYTGLDFSPDGMLLYAKTENSVEVFDMTQGIKHNITFPFLKDRPDDSFLKITKQQNTLVTSVEHGTAICNAEGQLKCIFNSYERLVSCCEIGWDDSLLLALKDGSLMKLNKSF
ncbi:unnamed protein product [Blepharisma stoltei]|uniref:Uncharacterized protein n=1 Tax=Blepharisma stoltei TaxID=1481888 RepID=A0AAU9JTS4_9CILI|nr:unnamed protein product [Blepharisma stoltei]